MNFEDFIISPRNFKTESWQIGNQITKEIKEDSIVLLLSRITEERMAMQKFRILRESEKNFINFHSWILKFRWWILAIWFRESLSRILIIFCRKFCRLVITKERFLWLWEVLMILHFHFFRIKLSYEKH